MLAGKIAAFLDDRSVVINIGSMHGVKPGMRFVATYKTDTITDPDNEEVALGDLSFEIATMQATNVQNKMTVCNILNPYYETISLSLWKSVNVGTSESKIDPREPKIADSNKLKLRVGTFVVEAPHESDQEQSAKKPAK